MEKMSLIGVNHPSMSPLMTVHEFIDILLSTSSKGVSVGLLLHSLSQ